MPSILTLWFDNQFSYPSLRELVNAVETGLDTFNIIESRIYQAVDFLDDLLNAMDTVKSDLTFVLESLNGFCPRVVNQVCRSISDPTTCTTVGLEVGSVNVGDSIQSAVAYLNKTGTLQSGIVDAKDSLLGLIPTLNSFHSYTQSINLAL